MCSNTNWFSSKICLLWSASCCWEDKARLWVPTHPKKREQPKLTLVLVSPPTTSNVKCDPKLSPWLLSSVTRWSGKGYRLIGSSCQMGEPQIPKTWGREKGKVGAFLALFLQISPGFWKMDVRQRAFGASSLMVHMPKIPMNWSPWLFCFIHILLRVIYSIPIQQKIEKYLIFILILGKWHLWKYSIMPLRRRQALHLKTGTHLSELTLNSSLGLRNWGGLISQYKTDNKEAGIVSGTWPWPGKFWWKLLSKLRFLHKTHRDEDPSHFPPTLHIQVTPFGCPGHSLGLCQSQINT